jgi:hypothetical protein
VSHGGSWASGCCLREVVEGKEVRKSAKAVTGIEDFEKGTERTVDFAKFDDFGEVVFGL